jgi:hypothetical protein
MEQNPPTAGTEAAPAAQNTQVMDVVAPPPVEAEPAPSSQPNAAPAENDQADKQDQPSEAVAKEVADQKDKPAPKAPKQPKNGVGLAIMATVLIVLGLAALATYAYLQTAK